MNTLNQVAWKGGIYIIPQHFQQAERALESQLQQRFSSLSPYAWGVEHLEVDEAAVAQGRLELKRLRCLLPDGTPVDVPAGESGPIGRGFELPSHGQPLDVFVTLPHQRPGTPLSSRETHNAEVRYLEREIQLRDHFDPEGGTRPVQVLNKNLRLSFGGEPLDGKVVMRLARIRRASDGKPCLDSDFAPALLTLASSPRLEKAMRELVTRLAARTQSMRKERFERTGQVMDFNRDDVRSYWYLHTLNQSLPVLEQLLKCPQLHPYTLYLELLRLSGGLLSFHSDAAQDIPDYNHEAPLQTFMALEAVLARQLEVMIVHRYERIDFTRDGEFSIATIKDPGLVRSGELVMVIPGSHRPDALRELERGLKIADIDSIDRVVARWLTGIPFQRVEALPASFPKAGEGIYLKLQRDQEFWPRISGTGQLAAFLPRSFATAQPYLIGVRGQTA